MTDRSRKRLLSRMREVVTRRADHIAVQEQDCAYTYNEFGAMIDFLYRELQQSGGSSNEPVGLLLDRSALAYATMWASIAHGRAYVPLNPKYPQSRLKEIIRQAGVGFLVCDPDTHRIAQTLGMDDKHLLVVTTEKCLADASTANPALWEGHSESGTAYVLFTSGSTGQPKGVPISYPNLCAFIDNMDSAIKYHESDICSQVCELSFDFSVHEIYLALLNGCTLCPARQIDLFNPAHFISKRSISVWISVPSLVRVILNNGISIGDTLRSIRISIFNGEALTSQIVEEWRNAAPNANIWNSYGPTECTVAVTTHPCTGTTELQEADVVCIGAPFPDCKTALLCDGHVVPTSFAEDGSAGELLLATPQRFLGYTDPNLPLPFVKDNHGEIYYRTGDRVRMRSDRFFHLGRTDHQVKIGGHRIELLEVEHRLRNSFGSEALAVIAYPAERPTELVAFVVSDSELPRMQAEVLGLPNYMLPSRTIVLDTLPSNAHGKLDRAALQHLAETEA